jgi:Cytochrome c biogenesis protein
VLDQYNQDIVLRYIPVDTEDAFALELLYEQYYRVDTNHAVKLFVGEQCLSGITAIRERLPIVLAEELRKESRTITPEEIKAELCPNPADEERVLLSRFSSLSPLLVASAGLADGVNPCAFVTIVFFISLCAALKKTRRDMLLTGMVFMLAVFITYLLLGIGVFRLIKVVSIHYGIAAVLRLLTGIIALVLGCVSLYDGIRYYYAKCSDAVVLKLPGFIRRMINRFLSIKLRSGQLIAGVFLSGVVVSLLESVCTGQMYAPTIVFILQKKELADKAMWYLILYNCMFVLPLSGVFFIAYQGVHSQRISQFLSRNVVIAKILLAVLFLILGFVLIRGFK